MQKVFSLLRIQGDYMNEKKQGGFKLSYIIVLLAAVLILSLLFIDFGQNGTKLETYQVEQIIQGD